MTDIDCRDTFIEDTALLAFGQALQQNHASIQAPNVSGPVTSPRTGTTYVLLIDPTVQFDETQTNKAAITQIMAQYNVHERT